jgi:hypothetical protein
MITQSLSSTTFILLISQSHFWSVYKITISGNFLLTASILTNTTNTNGSVLWVAMNTGYKGIWNKHGVASKDGHLKYGI